MQKVVGSSPIIRSSAIPLQPARIASTSNTYRLALQGRGVPSFVPLGVLLPPSPDSFAGSMEVLDNL